jgi:hypothetical protein
MANIVYRNKDYAIRITRYNYKIINIHNEDRHGHMNNFFDCVKLIDMMVHNKVPRNDYWFECAVRCSVDGEYRSLLLSIKERRESNEKNKLCNRN